MSKVATQELSSLVNTGAFVLNEGANDSSIGCTVVLGGARSGTSLVAGVLHHLGVYMGDKATPPVFEDVRLSVALETSNSEDVQDIVAAYENRAPWGFKRPGALGYFDRLEAQLPPRRYVVIFRDVFATANRNRLSVGLEILRGLERALRDNRNLVRCVGETDSPLMLCSYEKILNRPAEFVDALSGYASLSPDAGQKKRATAFIRPDPFNYLDSSRNTKATGTIEEVSANRIRGWARYVHQGHPAVVDLIVNGERVASQKAAAEREDLREAGKHPSGKCGFEFEVETPLEPGDRVRVRARDEIRDLTQEPVVFGK